MRDPPPEPTPVTFPGYWQTKASKWETTQTAPDFQALFSRVLKPGDITQVHADALNIELLTDCPPDELLPLAPDGTSYLPPLAPQEAINAASYADATKADPATSRKRKDFDERLIELQVANEMAYKTLTRSLRNGVKGPRLAYMRKFWEGLESMSQYWDCSRDEYFVDEETDEDGKHAKRQRLDSAQSDRTAAANSRDGNTASVGHDGVSKSEVAQNGKEAGDSSAASTVRSLLSVESQANSSPDQRYRGWRTGTGKNMPDKFRTDTVRSFIEGTVWPFQCTVAPPRQMPVVQFGALNLPVRQSAAVYRVPTDRMRARQGRLEGPLLAVQVRNDTDFHDQIGEPIEQKSRLDLMRELGGLLQIAQERQREGKQEVRPGEGKWWTTVPRWGGGAGGAMPDDDDSNDLLGTEEILDAIKEARGTKQKNVNHKQKRKTPAMLWKELKPGSSLWDPVGRHHLSGPSNRTLTVFQRTDYVAVGKEPLSQYDEVNYPYTLVPKPQWLTRNQVFMVSSINHHISILKLTVHTAYVDYLITGDFPEPLPNTADWCRPRLQRSQWYDFYSKEQRVEAFRSLWGVLSYLNHEISSGESGEQLSSDISMSNAQ